jgi:hypothetical protein
MKAKWPLLKTKKASELLKELLSLAELLPTTNRSGLCFVAVATTEKIAT